MSHVKRLSAQRILNAAELTSHGHAQGRKIVLEILEAGMRAADPYFAMKRVLRREGDLLIFGGDPFIPPGSPRGGDEIVDLTKTGRIFVFGSAKGVQRAARAVEEIVGDRLTGGLVIDKKGGELILERIEVAFGAHPVPDEGCAQGCRRIIELAADLRPDDLVITLQGNGTGSLMTLPVEGVSMADLQHIIYRFQIERGGPTADLVAIRNHLDQMKGGQFTRRLKPARVIHVLCFYTAPYDLIMNGARYRWMHTMPDETTHADAIRSLKKWDLWDDAPASIRDYLTHAGSAQETLKVAEFEAMDSRIFCLFPVELSVVPTARRKAEELGFRTHTLYYNYTMMAEAAPTGKLVGVMAMHSEIDGTPFQPPCVLLGGGELLVTVGKERGMGGRDQEFAVSAALQLANTRHVVIGAVDSDGTDGPGRQFVDGRDEIPVLTGGLVDGSTLRRAQELGVDLKDALKRHDTSPALYRLDDGIVAGMAMSMGDLHVALILDRGDTSINTLGL